MVGDIRLERCAEHARNTRAASSESTQTWNRADMLTAQPRLRQGPTRSARVTEKHCSRRRLHQALGCRTPVQAEAWTARMAGTVHAGQERPGPQVAMNTGDQISQAALIAVATRSSLSSVSAAMQRRPSDTPYIAKSLSRNDICADDSPV